MDIRLTSLKKSFFCSLVDSSFSALTATRTSFFGCLSMRPAARPEREMIWIFQVLTHPLRPGLVHFWPLSLSRAKFSESVALRDKERARTGLALGLFPPVFSQAPYVSFVPLKHNSGWFTMDSRWFPSYASHPLAVSCLVLLHRAFHVNFSSCFPDAFTGPLQSTLTCVFPRLTPWVTIAMISNGRNPLGRLESEDSEDFENGNGYDKCNLPWNTLPKDPIPRSPTYCTRSSLYCLSLFGSKWRNSNVSRLFKDSARNLSLMVKPDSEILSNSFMRRRLRHKTNTTTHTRMMRTMVKTKGRIVLRLLSVDGVVGWIAIVSSG